MQVIGGKKNNHRISSSDSVNGTDYIKMIRFRINCILAMCSIPERREGESGAISPRRSRDTPDDEISLQIHQEDDRKRGRHSVSSHLSSGSCLHLQGHLPDAGFHI